MKKLAWGLTWQRNYDQAACIAGLRIIPGRGLAAQLKVGWRATTKGHGGSVPSQPSFPPTGWRQSQSIPSRSKRRAKQARNGRWRWRSLTPATACHTWQPDLGPRNEESRTRTNVVSSSHCYSACGLDRTKSPFQSLRGLLMPARLAIQMERYDGVEDGFLFDCIPGSLAAMQMPKFSIPYLLQL